jgi:hypothetical protein
MSFFNITITLAVGMVMLGGAVLTYQHRMLERQDMERNPLAGVVAQNKTKGTGLAPLPKWDDKNYKGLTYR